MKRLLWACMGMLLLAASAQARQPSVIVMIADDQGWGDLSLHGNRNLSTPHLDQLAGQGARFERFHVQPVCAPTRAEFLTGRYAPRGGVHGVTSGAERLSPEVPTIADAFVAAGYRTAAFGKWHNGTQPPYHPLCRGFQQYYGFTSGHWGNYFNSMMDRNGAIARGSGYMPDDLTNELMAFVEQNQQHPFFALLAFCTPHSPMQVPDRWWLPHAEQELKQLGSQPEREHLLHTRAALAMVENIDWNVGRLLAKLDELKLAEDTIVIYLSDNGPNGHRFNSGMRGIKGTTDEGGVRSPLFIRWPGKLKAGQLIKQPAAAIDLAPTLAALTGVAFDVEPKKDGVNLRPLLMGQVDQLPERSLFAHQLGRVAARRGSLVLDHQGRLYDLKRDPGQTLDIAAENPDVVQRLQKEIVDWKRDVHYGKKDERPFTIGHPTVRLTQLPVRDATARGGIKRSNQHHNCTYFTNWTSTGDAVLWNAEVLVPGRYRATIYYTCSAEDVGSEVELRLNDASCRGVIKDAHDPPLMGAENDRFKRIEGYVKAFRPLVLGEIQLTRGNGELSLRAVKVPGKHVMDFRMLTLEWID